MPVWADITLTSATLFITCLGFWWANQRPHRVYRRRFFEEAVGNDGTNGLPRRPSLFDRLDKQDADVAAVKKVITEAALLNGDGKDLVRDVRTLKAWTVDHSALHDVQRGDPK